MIPGDIDQSCCAVPRATPGIEEKLGLLEAPSPPLEVGAALEVSRHMLSPEVGDLTKEVGLPEEVCRLISLFSL